MRTVPLTHARYLVGPDLLPIAGATDERFTVGVPPPFSHLPQMVITLKANSPSIDVIREQARRIPLPIDITRKARPPKRRRHARSGLRPMVAARSYRYTALGLTSAVTRDDGRVVFSMSVTRRRD